MLILLLCIFFGVGILNYAANKVIEDGKLPTTRQLIQQEETEAWTRLGEHEIELFLAPLTTPDDDDEVAFLPTPTVDKPLLVRHQVDQYAELALQAQFVYEERCRKADAPLEEIRAYVYEKTKQSGSKSDVLHALNPNTICLPESWSGQVRAKANDMHTERNCPLWFSCSQSHLDD